MDDSSLCQLIREALSDGNRAEALTLAIDQLPKIKAYLGQGWLPYYDEALPVTMRDVQRNIQGFPQMCRLNLDTLDCQNPSEATLVQKRFISWVVMILKRDCHDVKRGQRNRPKTVSLSDPAGPNNKGTIGDIIEDPQTRINLGTLIAEEELQENKRQEQELKRLIESLVCHPEGYPHCTCYELIQRRMLRENSQQWREIEIELKTPYGTMTAHWHRKCKKRLGEIAKNFSNKEKTS